MNATFAAFGIDAVYTPAGGEPMPVSVRVIAGRPGAIVSVVANEGLTMADPADHHGRMG